MSILAMSKENQEICDKYDLCEYGTSYLVTMPSGYRFISTQLEDNDFALFKNDGAIIEILPELGL